MWIELTASDGHRLAAWRDGPANATRALVVVQEIFGVNNHMRNVCARFAREGYAVIAPALFDRTQRGTELTYSPEDVARGRALRSHVPEAGTLADIEAAATALPAMANEYRVSFGAGTGLACRFTCVAVNVAA